MQIRLSSDRKGHRSAFIFALETPDGDGVETRLSKHDASLLVGALNHFIESASVMGYFEDGIEYIQEVP